MRAGLMRDQVTIERNTPTIGSTGEEIDAWATYTTTWAHIRGSGGEENIKNLMMRVRHQDILHTDRVVFGTRTFDIVSVRDSDGMARDLVIELREDTRT